MVQPNATPAVGGGSSPLARASGAAVLIASQCVAAEVAAHQPEAPDPSGAAPQSATPEVVVLAERPRLTASSAVVGAHELGPRGISNVQDLLRATPGLVVVQHSGGGKANQYFLRGFDADHGTDLALSVDGVPINMVSHAHGQGFSDANFIIPELVERVEITKGPYFVAHGDFATAGAINFVSRNDVEHSSVGAGVFGSRGHGRPGYRALGIAGPTFDQARAIFAAEIAHADGPFDKPEDWDSYRLFNKVSWGTNGLDQLSIGHLGYAANWRGAGQVPERAVERGLVPRFGSIDRDEGGNTARHQLFAHYRLELPEERGALEALAYVARYRFNLFSNFTVALADPTLGDEIEQVDRRTFFGGRASYRVAHELGPVRFETTLGADGRNDAIQGELWNTASRVRRGAVRSSDIHQTFVGAYIDEAVSPAPWLRLKAGARVDSVTFAVDDRLAAPSLEAPPASGVGADMQLSPKLNLVLSPVRSPPAEVDVFVSYGHGFHSNDVRGVFVEPRVTPLARAVGAELGSRARLGRWHLAAALWHLDSSAETVWVGDEGTTEVGPATRRLGVELESRYDVTSWLSADLDLTWTRSGLQSDFGAGDGLPLAPKQTWSGGLSALHELGPGVVRGGIRFFGLSDRPASDDGALVAPGFTQLDAHVGYRTRWVDLAFDVENVLDRAYRAAQFATVSRLEDEPMPGAPVPGGFTCGGRGRLATGADGLSSATFEGCEDVAYTPAYPLTVRFMATVFLD